MQFPSLQIKNRHTRAVTTNGGCVHLGYKQDKAVINNFLEAVKINPDDAWYFVSRVYSFGLDLNELQEILSSSAQFCKWVFNAAYLNDTKNYLTRSLYIDDPAQNLRRLLHLRMVFEPDQYGLWKIYGVEQEECVRI